MPHDIQHAQLLHDPMAPQHLQRNHRGILQTIAHDFPVEDLQGPIVAGVGKEREFRMEGHGPDSLGMVPERLIRRRAEIEVVPEEFLVVARDEQVVALRVQGDGGDPAGARLEFLLELLVLQVVDADALAGGEEEEGFARVEAGGLREALEAFERVLGEVFAEGVDGDGGGGGWGRRGHGREVVAATVEGEGFRGRAEGQGQEDALVLHGGVGASPGCGARLFGSAGGLGGGLLLSGVTEAGVEDGAAGGFDLWVAEVTLWNHEVDLFPTCGRQNKSVLSWSPSDDVHRFARGQLDSP